MTLRQSYQDLTSGTMSRLHLSSKLLPGVQEDMDLEMVLDGREHPSKVSVQLVFADLHRDDLELWVVGGVASARTELSLRLNNCVV